MKKPNPHHDPNHRSLGRWMRFHSVVTPQGYRDNPVRKYTDTEKYARWYDYNSTPLEETIRKAIRKERDYWRTPYWIVEAEEYPYSVPDDQKKYKKQHWAPEDCDTIRQKLSVDDSKYRNTWQAKGRGHQKVRVPSLKRSDREWMNFYRSFPEIAKTVAIGDERFVDGAKLKYIPLFKQILDEEWPENLKMWTDEQYEDLMRKGVIEPYEQYIIKNLID